MMATLKALDDAAKASKISRRLLQKWLSEGKLKRWQKPGDRKRYVNMDEVKRFTRAAAGRQLARHQ